MNNGLHVKYPLLLSILMKLELSQHIFQKYSNIKFHEYPSSWSQVVSCACGRTDINILMVPFCNFVNVSKNYQSTFEDLLQCHFRIIN